VDVDVDDPVDKIKALRDAGHIVICYFSSGTLEPWRKDCTENKTAWQVRWWEVVVGEVR
jgi:endo-alpha-1,4-polygalactosaminidase (GH114 family)